MLAKRIWLITLAALSIMAAFYFRPSIEKFIADTKARQERPVFDSLSHPAKKVSFWKDVMSRPLERRLIEAPPILVDYIGKDNVAQGWPNQTRSIKLDAAFKADLLKALLSLPPAVLRKIESSLAFISVVRDLGGTAYADYLVTDDKGFAPYGFIVFDTEV
ncbi:MAG: hypothetical protein AAB250_00650, partial [Bdellovibrionota bacterium]